jgi:hypothetical protein
MFLTQAKKNWTARLRLSLLWLQWVLIIRPVWKGMKTDEIIMGLMSFGFTERPCAWCKDNFYALGSTDRCMSWLCFLKSKGEIK